MTKRVWLVAAWLSVACFLSGCGGGGGGDSSAPSGGGLPAEGGASGLSFSPASVSQTVKERSVTPPITIIATSSKLIAERINVAITDTVGVLDPDATSVTALSDTSYQARLSLSPSLKPGTYRGSFKVQLCLDDPLVCKQPYSGSPWSIPFDIEVTPWAEARTVHKLLVSETGVALTSASHLSRLTHSVNVSDNLGAASHWQATSDQPWLKVTPSGTADPAGGVLQMEADPSELVANEINYAKVTVTSSDAAIAAAEPIVVALWKGTNPVRQRVSAVPVTSYYSRVLADPIRPHAYALRDGGVIDIYNIYTGAQVGSLSAAGAMFSKMLASPDGAFLYAVDWAASQVKVFDLRSNQMTGAWPLDAALTAFSGNNVDMAYARPNGVGVVVLTTGQVFRASDGAVMARDILPNGHAPSDIHDELQASYIAASPDGMRIYSTGSRLIHPNTPFYWDIDYSEVNAGTLSWTRAYSAKLFPALPGAGDKRLPSADGIAVQGDGQRVFMLSGQSIYAWSPTDLSPEGMLPQAGGLGLDARVVMTEPRIAVAGGDYSLSQFHVVSPEGVLLKTLSTSLPTNPADPGLNRIIADQTKLVVSADGSVVIQPAGKSLMFTPISP